MTRGVAAVLVLGALFFGSSPAAGPAAAPTQIVNLGGAGSVRFTVPASSRAFQWSIQSAQVVGDLNGDGIPDIAVAVNRVHLLGNSCIGCCNPPPAPLPTTDFVQVIFGGHLPSRINLAKPYARGFRIYGAPSGSDLGASVAGVGDVNGDGLADLAIGVPGNDAGSPGGAYVVYGKRSTSGVDLADLGTGGFAIAGSPAANQAGEIVEAGGDVNGDGRPDILVGATWRTPAETSELQHQCGDLLVIPPPNSQQTTAYVVFGGARTGTVDLGDLGSGGFQIEPSTATEDISGNWLADAGDLNGDGRADIAIGTETGAIVVFGKRSTIPVDPATLGRGGMTIDGIAGRNRSVSVAGVGDVNGDHLADLAIGCDFGANFPVGSKGADGPSGWIIFGSRSAANLDLHALGSRGFEIDGTRDHAGNAYVPLGDLNGDGLADFGVLLAGKALDVVYGKRSTSPVLLYDLGTQGAAIEGSIWGVGGITGRSVLVTGDQTELVPFAPTIAPPSPVAAGSLKLNGDPIVALSAGFGSVWALVASLSSPVLDAGETEYLYRLDPASDRILGRPLAIPGPSRVVATIDGSVWVLVSPAGNTGSSLLLRIDPTTGEVVKRMSVAVPGVAPDNHGFSNHTIGFGLGSLWITYCGTHSVYRLDPATGKLLAAIKAGHCPQAVTIAGGKVWVADREDGAVREIDPRIDRVVGNKLKVMIDPGKEGQELGDMLWLGTSASGSVWIYDQNDERVVRLDPLTRKLTFDPPNGTRSLIAAPAGSTLWVAGFNLVGRIDLHSGKLIGSTLEYDTVPSAAVAAGNSMWTTTFLTVVRFKAG